MKALVAGAVLLFAVCGARAAELPIFDAHLHYSHDAWESVPPKEAIALLRKAGLRRAVVSSSNDDGNQMYYFELDEDRLHADGERILRRLDLSPAEREDLVAFLESLSDSP